MAERAEQFAVIEGWVCERIREPVIGVMFWPGATQVSVVVGEVDKEHGSFRHRRMDTKSAFGSRFGIDQMAAARSFASELASEFGVEAVQYARVEQAAEWAVRFRGETETLRAAADEVVNAFAKSLGNVDEHLGLAVFDLMHATVAAPGINPAILDAVLKVDAQRAVLETNAAASAHGPYHVEERPTASHHDVEEKPDNAMGRLSRAVALWHRRESAGMEWVEGGLPGTGTYAGTDAAYEVTSLMEADEIGAALGVDLSDQAAEAARGSGHLIAVETAGRVSAIAFARTTPDGPEIAKVFTRHGAKPQKRIVDIAAEHAASGFAHEEIDELAMAGL
jgi:hypothetical protein